ncbi:MAG: galactose mutarotase [Rikenellaceae bacterium]|nr:galactose mutarotase [Rikenellaceae bacterium]
MMEITQDVWGVSPEGEVVILYTITNASGASVQLTNLGAAIVAVNVPDREGRMANVALGYRDMASYFGDGPYMGKSVGRYANRMGGAAFTLDGTHYQLPPNEGHNQLHGGAGTLANRVWEARVEGNRVVFAIESPDGDQGYPGNLTVEAAYHWSDECELEIVYTAVTDAPTVVNLTNHAYFNLGSEGENSGSVLGHVLQLRASQFVPTRPDSIPTGELWAVEGTPMDFRTAKTLGQDINADYPQITDAAGYDRCWVVDGWQRNILAEVGTLSCPETGRRMTILTSQPGIQLYTGNFLQGSPVGRSGRPYSNRDGVALECQGFPDAPNHPGFPDQTLRPADRYIQKIVYRFTVE